VIAIAPADKADAAVVPAAHTAGPLSTWPGGCPAPGGPSRDASTAMCLALNELEAGGRACHMCEGPARW
jgi:hypothetical protein